MLTQVFMIKYYNTFMKKTQNQFNTKNLIRKFLGIVSLFLFFGLYSCEEEPSSLGSNLIPDEDKIQYYYDTSLTFQGNTYINDPIPTVNQSFYNIGYIDDEHFGKFKGEFAAQFLPIINYTKDSVVANFDVDSVVLYLVVDSIYGSPLNDLEFNVYELNSTLEAKTYYSDEEIDNYYDPTDKINTTSVISGDSLIRLRLSSAFTDKLISDNDLDTVYKNNTNFLSVFKGLAVTPDVLETPQGLFIVNMASSKITLFHNDTLEYSYSFVKEYATPYRFASYTNDYTNAIANNYLTNADSINDELLYLQGINGLLSEITFNNIDPWIQNDSLYSILNAELYIPVYEDDNFNTFYPPNMLFIQYSLNDTTLYTIEDFENNIADGTYNDEEKYYHFSVPKHLMSMTNNGLETRSLKLNINNRSTFPQRVILKSGENIKLRVTYTKH